jgi:predicted enzyme related to lactoylglutathione lyase
MSDDDDLRYTTLSVDGREVTGVLDGASRLGDAPSHRVVYWQVDDVDLALSRVAQLGGTLRQAASDSPYGRVATAADPAGAEFHLLSV